MDPITIAILIALFGGAAVIKVISLSLKEVLNWIRGRISSYDANHVGITLMEKLSSGDYKVVRGIFNQQTKKIVQQETLQAQTVDAELLQRHNGRKQVLYAR